MRSDFIPGRDELFEAFATNLASKLPSYATTLGIPAATVTAFATEAAAFTTKLQYVVEITSSKKAAVSDKKNQRHTTEELIRTINNLAQVSPNKTDTILNELQLPIRSTGGSPLDAFTPTNLVAKPNGVNGNTLKWNRNGNGAGIIFFVEYKLEDGIWRPLGVTTKASFKDSSGIPGQVRTYRVYARSATKTSDYSVYASVYDGPEQFSLKVEKAA